MGIQKGARADRLVLKMSIENKKAFKKRMTKTNNYSDKEKTKRGLIKLLYKGQVSHSIDRGWPKPDYTLIKLQEMFLIDKEFDRLYIKWVRSRYKAYLKPVIDRINCLKYYAIGNIQALSTIENNKKGATTDRALRKRIAKIVWDNIA